MSSDGASTSRSSSPSARPRPEEKTVSTAFRVALWLVRALAIFGLVVGAVTLRVVYAGELELAASNDALVAGNPHEAIVRARRSARWYAPGAPHVRVAYGRLEALAKAAEEHNEAELSLLAWRSIRSAVLETRWAITPHRERLEMANREIARLEAKQPRPSALGAEPPSSLERQQLVALAAEPGPRTTWIIVLVAGFVAWVAGLGATLRFGVDPVGRLHVRRAAAPVGLALLGLLAWLAAMWMA